MKLSVFFHATIGVLLLTSAASAERPRALRVLTASCKEFSSSVYQPCVCADKVPNTIKYRPSVKECGGKAAAILSGEYLNSYSVVLRDNQNRDRWPAAGYHGCSAAQVALGLNQCSAFKCQKIIKTSLSSVASSPQQICCFGEAGNSRILAGATRLTIKLRDDPNTKTDPLVRACLNKFSPLQPLN